MGHFSGLGHSVALVVAQLFPWENLEKWPSREDEVMIWYPRSVFGVIVLSGLLQFLHPVCFGVPLHVRSTFPMGYRYYMCGIESRLCDCLSWLFPCIFSV